MSLNSVLGAILFAALAIRIAVALHLPSIEYPDEIFESLEPAHRLAFGYGVVTWEWIVGIRSWIFPGFLAGIMRATAWLGSGSRGYLAAVTVVLCLISLTSVWFGFAWCRKTSTEAAIIAAGACSIWMPLVYFAPRAFTEVVAGNLLLPGLYLGTCGKLESRRYLFFAGFFCGLAMSLRIQLAPAAAFAVLYFCRSDWRRKAPAVFAGFLLPILAFGLVDWFTWSYPFQTFIRNFWVNTIEGKSDSYGTFPWYWYARFLVEYLGPALPLSALGVRRGPLLAWVILIIVGSHSLVPHKEARFLYPVIPLAMTLAALGIVEIASLAGRYARIHLPSEAVVVFGLVLFAASSAFIARRFPRWSQASGGLIAMDQLSSDKSLCGVGLYNISWAYTGGYTHLHRHVPIILALNQTELEGESIGFNALITTKSAISSMRLKPEICWNKTCLYRRPGPCIASSKYNEVNKMLRSGYQ